MKVTLFLDKSQGDTIEVKDKILSVLKPDHIIFDHWNGDEIKTKFYINSIDGERFEAFAKNKEFAIVEYIGYCNGEDDSKVFENYAQILTWDKLIATFNNKYAKNDGDKILYID